jgi:integrase
MNIHFKLRKQGKVNPKIIMHVFDGRFEGRKFMYSTGQSVPGDHWDKRKSRAKAITAHAAEYEALNKYLDKLEQTVISFKSERHNSASLRRLDLKNYLLKSQDNERREREETLQKESNFFKTWERIISEAKTSKGEGIGAGTRVSKTQTLRLVRKYAAENYPSLTFEDIDMNFYHGFDAYMKEKGLNGNSRGRHFKEIKSLMREAVDRDIKVNFSFQKKSFKVIRGTADNTYLNEQEIERLQGLSLTPGLERIRDIFVMACFVGARHSDWSQISESNVLIQNGIELLKIRQTKTGDTIHVPVHPIVRGILNKYRGNPPKVISNQKFNEALKDMCKTKEANLGNVMINGRQVEKWTEITTHTARRSFATNAYFSGSLDVYQIMRCTGHKTEASFLLYLKLDGKDYALKAAESKFFRNESWKGNADYALMAKAS